MINHPIQLAAAISNTGVPDPNKIDDYVPTVGTTPTDLSGTWNRLTTAGTEIIDILLWTAGAILVISVIMHSISYISSGGDAGKAGQARQGLINSAIGLIIVTLTFVIVRAIIAIVTVKVI